ncbi:VIT1/CCC1 family predicted Fe2+/Mn2+ transporter [Panacagrimonas perspica]|uniref:VIT1/CCC1 family predicted Fe2+/Mn2+ transporter n=1 Tax=Panacagrimonas perspica TaxID=381431 RepID=A0A4S3KA90_9GAMM|nr:VIT family protein [Panacagrimonas perspica]TDU32252.1 VIT1/CCC1 family predicted Fe2+/Mn2+ transporter [Panacagrimonas perspica]THD05199.1 nodulin 21 [Panacagrimonas perspica]
MPSLHHENHRASSVGWLRAAVLGANDGIISVASLVIGVAAAETASQGVLVTSVAGLVAGAMSMAAGEYVSVRTQADAETADLNRETRELADEPERELAELETIYRSRGLDPDLARRVAEQLTAKDPLGTHARDELGITEALRARPLQAALASAAAFSTGALVPLATACIAPFEHVATLCAGAALLALVTLGAIAARAGGAPVLRGALRVGFWGALAMGFTALIGDAVGALL